MTGKMQEYKWRSHYQNMLLLSQEYTVVHPNPDGKESTRCISARVCGWGSPLNPTKATPVHFPEHVPPHKDCLGPGSKGQPS